VEHTGSTTRFSWVKAPTNDELAQLTHIIVQRIALFLERLGLLQRDAEHSYLASDAMDDDSMAPFHGHSVTCMDAPMPQAQATAWIRR